MNSGQTIFAQLMEFLSHYEFQKCVQRYDGERKVKTFSCQDFPQKLWAICSGSLIAFELRDLGSGNALFEKTGETFRDRDQRLEKRAFA